MATAPKKPGGPFGGYRTRQEQLDAQEAAASFMPEEEENGNGARRRKKVDNYPWDFDTFE
jgi:hypothetical protein